jgi:lantibiotic biosynthesis protein
MDAFLETSFSIARRLCRDAIWAGDRCNWVGPSLEPGGPWSIAQKSFGPDLYSGTSGTALFLASLLRYGEERIVRKTAEAALAQAFSRVDSIPTAARIGVYSGALGIAWVLITVGELLTCDEWRDRGISLVDRLARQDLQGQEMDLLSGLAGAIPVLLALSRRYGRPDWAHTAVRCGEYLERAAVRSPEGWSWKTIEIPERDPSHNLTGFAHGTAGIGWALLELGSATGVPQFCEAAREAFRYERTHYSAEQENWPDFRDYLRPPGSSHAPAFSTAWCHGAPGIGLSRLRAWQLTGDALFRREAETALRTTVRMLESPNAANAGFSLCHGCAGNADLLLEASAVLDAPAYYNTAADVGSRGIEQYESQRLPWPCGVPGAGETKNLMLGTAGIGYFYLRLHALQTPTVLMIGSQAFEDGTHSQHYPDGRSPGSA